MIVQPWISILVCTAACIPPGATTAPPPPIYVSSSTSVGLPQSVEPSGLPPNWRGVQVFIDKRVDRPTEVIGVLDFHSDANSEDKGFDQLRARAAAMGADAVLGAEFEHGDGDEPSHLSGIVVRFLDH
jgi:hypothetical protein